MAESREIEGAKPEVEKARLEIETWRLRIEARRSAVRVWVTYALSSGLGIVLCLASALRNGFHLERREVTDIFCPDKIAYDDLVVAQSHRNELVFFCGS